jgi:hypothetical protein
MSRNSSLLSDDIEHFNTKIVENEVEGSDDHEVISILYQVQHHMQSWQLISQHSIQRV